MPSSHLFVGLDQFKNDPILRGTFPVLVAANRVLESSEKGSPKKGLRQGALRRLSICQPERDEVTKRAERAANRRLRPEHRDLGLFIKRMHPGALGRGSGITSVPFVVASFPGGVEKVDVIATATAWVNQLRKTIEMVAKFGDTENKPWFEKILNKAETVMSQALWFIRSKAVFSHEYEPLSGFFKAVAQGTKAGVPEGSGIEETAEDGRKLCHLLMHEMVCGFEDEEKPKLAA